MRRRPASDANFTEPGLWLDRLSSGLEKVRSQKPAIGGPKNQSGPPIELFTEDGTPSGIFISDVVFVPNAPLPAPNVNPNGVVNAASFRLGSPPETIMSLFGTNLSERIESHAGLPLPTELAGTSVTVTDSDGNQTVAAISSEPTNLSTLSSLFFVAPNQLNFFMPAGLAFGPATVTVVTEDGNSSSTTVAVVPCNPGLFAANDQGFGVAKANFVRGNPDGSQDRDLLFNPLISRPYPLISVRRGPWCFSSCSARACAAVLPRQRRPLPETPFRLSVRLQSRVHRSRSGQRRADFARQHRSW